MRSAQVAGIVLAGALLAACSMGSDASFSIFVDPAEFQFRTCSQIADELKNWQKRQQDLKALIDKADQSTGGAAVGFVAYKADYVAAGEEIDLLRSTARSKKCDQEQTTWGSNSAIR